MGLGSMMAGGNPAEGRQDNDFYSTPPEVTHALLLKETFHDDVWECAAGSGAMSDVLQLHGYTVVSTDVNPQRDDVKRFDFLKRGTTRAPSLVTNPPFSLAEPFIRHAHKLGVEKMALLLKSSFWHAKSRMDLWNLWQPARIYPLLWRPDFMGKGRPTMEVAWFVWERDRENADTLYRPLAKPTESDIVPRLVSL